MRYKKYHMSMTERWEALMNRQPVDRVSFLSFGHSYFSCKNTGYKVLDIFTDMEKYFEAGMKTAEQYGYYPFCYATPGGYYGTWEFGGVTRMPKSEFEMAPIAVRFPAETEKEAWNLKLPDVKTAGSLPTQMEFCKLQESMSGLPIVPTVHTVVTLAGNLVDLENLCRWMKKSPELVHHLVRLAAEHFVEVAKYWVHTFGPERVMIFSAAASESNQIISPKQFEEFVLPYQKEAHEKVLALGIKHIYVHICGDHNLNMPFWGQIPMGDPGIVTFGHEVDLETAAEYFPKDVIVGNINPITLLNGSKEEVYEACKICIEKGKKAPGGYMLAAGCSIPYHTPSDNFAMMHQALEDFGWYE